MYRAALAFWNVAFLNNLEIRSEFLAGDFLIKE